MISLVFLGWGSLRRRGLKPCGKTLLDIEFFA